MPQVVTCPGCAKRFKVAEKFAGRTINCPLYKTAMTIPPAQLPSAPIPSEPPPVEPTTTVPAPADLTPATNAQPPAAPSLPLPVEESTTDPAPPVQKIQQPTTAPITRKIAPPTQTPPQPPRLKTAPAPNQATPTAKKTLPPPAPAAAPPTTILPPSPDPFDDELRLTPDLSAKVYAPLNQSGFIDPVSPSTTATNLAPRANSPTAASSSTDAQAQPVLPPVAFAKKSRLRRFLYVAFALTLIPLAFFLGSDKLDYGDQLDRTVAAHPEIADRMKSALDEAESAESPTKLNDFLENGIYELLPDGKLDGAHLAHQTWMHWIYAFAAALLFLAAIRTLFEPGHSTIVQIILVALTTATVGIVNLLIFQWLAELSQGFWFHGGNIVVLIAFYVIKFIGWSYHAALDPNNSLLLSLVGFTFGVGLCEEIVKAIPIIAATGMDRKLDWRGACAWGLASGVGFGVAEGIMYSSSHYNGVAGVDIYVVRFISCVALHAIWTGAASIMIWQNQANLAADVWYIWLLQLLRLVAVPMALHGLYDTLLKRGLTPYAILVALASFAWLVFSIERARAADMRLFSRRAADMASA